MANFLSTSMWSVKNGNKQIKNRLIKLCGVNLCLNSKVTYIGSSSTEPNLKNSLKFNKDGVDKEKKYDYIICAFPLLKDDLVIDFDFEYKDHNFCEMIKSKTFFVHGELNLQSVPNMNKSIKLVSSDTESKFLTIETIDEKLYKVVLSDKGSLDNLFKSYEIVKEYETLYPNYKKLQDSEASKKSNEGNYRKKKDLKSAATESGLTTTKVESSYPRVIVDSKEGRSRIFNLNSINWLMSSDELECINARNIALLISKKEQGNESTLLNNRIYARSKRNYYNDACGIISSFSIFLLVCAFWFKEPKLKNINLKYK
jgi:hypothetical protein